MIPKSGGRFSDEIMLEPKGMIPKSGSRFSDEIMRDSQQAARDDAKKSPPDFET